MSKLPRGLEGAFAIAAGELGFASAAWLFVREVAAEGGDDLVRTLRDELGRAFPVLDAVAAHWLDGLRQEALDPEPIVAACAGATTVLIVGLEAGCLDALIPRLRGQRPVLLRHSLLADVDWERVQANYEGDLEIADLNTFQRWAGTRSVILTMVYGADGHSACVQSAWLRLNGEDVRTQFQAFIGWDVLRQPMFVYPRWLVEVPCADFTVIV
jgi:hypothetical protein